MMRPGQQNKRGRGRNNNNNNNSSSNNNNNGGNNNRKGGNPLTRSYDSSGPDVKIRGTAQHIAEKYSNLARDAQSSGDRVVAENYLQHAEHYNRIIAAAQAQMQERYQREERQDYNDQNESERDQGSMDMDNDDSGNVSQPVYVQAPEHRPVQQPRPPRPVQEQVATVPTDINSDDDAPVVVQPPRQRQPRPARVPRERNFDQNRERYPETPQVTQTVRPPEPTRQQESMVEQPAPVAVKQPGPQPVIDGSGPQPDIEGIPAEVALDDQAPARAPRRRAPVRPRRQPRAAADEGDADAGDSKPTLAVVESE